MKRISESGQTIIEAVVALSVLIVIMGAIAVISTTGVRNSSFEKDQNVAAKYAKEGMEYIRYLRNSGNTSLKTYEGRYCMPNTNGSTGIFSAGQGNPACQLDQANIQNNTYVREVEFNQSNAANCNGETLVTVRVKWTSSKCDPSTPQSRFCHKSEVVSCFDTGTTTSP